MKKILSVVLFAFMAVQFSSAQDVNKLPVEARNFINQHFSKSQISNVKENSKLLGENSYEVLFADGMEVTFDSKGNWKEIDMKKDRIPAAVIPSSVNNYVQKTYSSNHVTKIEHDSDGYDVKLNNGLSLEFDKTGAFKKVND